MTLPRYWPALLAAALLTTCRPARPTSTSPPAVADTARLAIALPRDSATPLTSPITKPGLLARIFDRGADKYDEKKPSKMRGFLSTNSALRKCKGCTFIVSSAPVTVAGKKATVAAPGATLVQASKKAVAVAADSGAAVQVATTKKGQAAAGEGITQQQVKPAGWPWWLWLLLAGLVGYGGYRVYRKFFTV